jgi:hypothetical protein
MPCAAPLRVPAAAGGPSRGPPGERGHGQPGARVRRHGPGLSLRLALASAPRRRLIVDASGKPGTLSGWASRPLRRALRVQGIHGRKPASCKF